MKIHSSSCVVGPVIYFIWQGAAVAGAEAGDIGNLGTPELALADGHSGAERSDRKGPDAVGTAISEA